MIVLVVVILSIFINIYNNIVIIVDVVIAVKETAMFHENTCRKKTMAIEHLSSYILIVI